MINKRSTSIKMLHAKQQNVISTLTFKNDLFGSLLETIVSVASYV